MLAKADDVYDRVASIAMFHGKEVDREKFFEAIKNTETPAPFVSLTDDSEQDVLDRIASIILYHGFEFDLGTLSQAISTSRAE